MTAHPFFQFPGKGRRGISRSIIARKEVENSKQDPSEYLMLFPHLKNALSGRFI
jgi:hypothetical protein